MKARDDYAALSPTYGGAYALKIMAFDRLDRALDLLEGWCSVVSQGLPAASAGACEWCGEGPMAAPHVSGAHPYSPAGGGKP